MGKWGFEGRIRFWMKLLKNFGIGNFSVWKFG
jgi:hypothetical protein